MRFRTAKNYTKRQMNQDHFDSVRLYMQTQEPDLDRPTLAEQVAEAEAAAVANVDNNPEFNR